MVRLNLGADFNGYAIVILVHELSLENVGHTQYNITSFDLRKKAKVISY